MSRRIEREWPPLTHTHTHTFRWGRKLESSVLWGSWSDPPPSFLSPPLTVPFVISGHQCYLHHHHHHHRDHSWGQTVCVCAHIPDDCNVCVSTGAVQLWAWGDLNRNSPVIFNMMANTVSSDVCVNIRLYNSWFQCQHVNHFVSAVVKTKAEEIFWKAFEVIWCWILLLCCGCNTNPHHFVTS